MICQNEDDF